MAFTTETQFESIHHAPGRSLRDAANYADLRVAAEEGTYQNESTRYVIVRDLEQRETFMVLTGEQFIEAVANFAPIDLVAVYRR